MLPLDSDVWNELHGFFDHTGPLPPRVQRWLESIRMDREADAWGDVLIDCVHQLSVSPAALGWFPT